MRAVVGGNLQLVGNEASITAERNTVDGDIQVFESRGGAIRVAGNVVAGNLQCKQNEPAPTGGDNRVSGSKEDQCSSL